MMERFGFSKALSKDERVKVANKNFIHILSPKHTRLVQNSPNLTLILFQKNNIRGRKKEFDFFH